MIADGHYPLISVLIPNYNYVTYVATAVDSAVAQTYPNVEVIVCDNASTDGAWELLCERYAGEPRVQLYRNEQNIGMARNFDRLLSLARGEYVVCLSSDDFMLPPHLERLMDGFRKDPTLDVVYCNAYFAREDGTVYATRQMPGEFPVSYTDARDELVENFTTVCPVCFPCALFKRDVLLEPGMCGDAENGQAARDWELVIRLALAGKRFGYVARPGTVIRIHDAQFSGDEYHRSGRNVVDFASYVERYIDHPEFVHRMRGREAGVAKFLSALVSDGALRNNGRSPFTADQLAWFSGLQARLNERAEAYEPARVRESKVSIVVQTAGSPRPLVDALRSLDGQTFPNWELLVVDHGAIDCEALLSAQPSWNRTSYVRLPAPATTGAARNLALRMARGEYVAFLDPDNRFAPEHLEHAVDTVERTGAAAAYASARLVVERTDDNATGAHVVGEAAYGADEADLARLAVAQTIPLDAFVAYRGVFDLTGTFNATVPALDDWDFTVSLSRAVRCAPTRATTLDVVARLNLAVQRLAVTYPHYITIMDALYAAHPVDARLAEERARHRAAVAEAVRSGKDWVREPHGLVAFMQTLAGRAGAAASFRIAQTA